MSLQKIHKSKSLQFITIIVASNGSNDPSLDLETFFMY